MVRCAFLTLADPTGFVIDDELAITEMLARGLDVSQVAWTELTDWSEFDLVVIRTPWDYHRSPQRFLEVLREIDSQTRLVNPLDLVLWNIDKRYLRDLESEGIAIVPTLDRIGFGPESYRGAVAKLGCGEVIVKPSVSANAEDTYRVVSEPEAAALQPVFEERPVLIQPFLQTIVDQGEESLFYFGGRYSHAVRKVPAPGDFRVQEEHGGEITPLEPSPDSLALAENTLKRLATIPVYARIDLVRGEGGAPLLIELELIEPSLYFRMSEHAAGRFADAVLDAI